MQIKTESTQLEYKFMDVGLFIGFTTAPIGREIEFYQNIFKNGLFNSYKEAVRKNFSPPKNDSAKARNEFEKYLYVPIPFFIFGRFDLAIISLIDDFEFGTRTFGPFDPMCPANAENDPNLLDFSHQIIVGPIPKLAENQDIEMVARDLSITPSDQSLPLIAICQIKLNSGTLLGAGLDILSIIIRAIQMEFEKYKFINKNIQLFISCSYAWNELTLILFSTSYKKMADFILFVREFSFADLIKTYDESVDINNKQNDLNFLEQTGKRRLIYDIIESLSRYRGKDHLSCHIFDNFKTTYGCTLDFFNSEEEKKGTGSNSELKASIEDDEIMPICEWSVKAGHLSPSMSSLNGLDDLSIWSCIGKGDFVYPCLKLMKTSSFLELIIKSRKLLKKGNHVFSSYTNITYTLETPFKPFNKETHLFFQQEVAPELQIPLSEIRQIDSRLTLLGIPKTISERVENMLANYNNGIMDSSLFGYFIELKPVMNWVVELVGDWAEESPEDSDIDDMSNYLTAIVDAFDIAYRNRYYSCYRMNEITDFNIEFKGAVQQLASVFDAAFKAILPAVIPREQLDKDSSLHVFSLITGTPWVSTTEYSLSLNYIHIWQPEFFASFIGHEIANLEANYYNKETCEIPPEEEISKFVYLSLKQPLDDINRTLNILTCQELFSYVSADINNYYLSYFADSSLFSFWYWGHWYSMPSSHSKVNKINELKYVAMLMRILSVFHLCDENFIKTNSISQSGKATVLNNIEMKWLEPTRKYIEELWKVDAFARWATKTKESARKKFYNTSKFDYQADNIGDIQHNYKVMASKFSQQLESGLPVRYRADKESASNINACNYTLSMLHAYLIWIKARCGDNNRFFQRTNPKEIQEKVIKDDASYLFDSRGGVFTRDPLFRRQYLQYRNALIMSFLDMASIEKKNLVMKHLRQIEAKTCK